MKDELDRWARQAPRDEPPPEHPTWFEVGLILLGLFVLSAFIHWAT